MIHSYLNSFTTKRSRGFTLIELLVVIAIIGILASIVLASLSSARLKGRDARRIADLKQIQLALELYFDSTGNSYPTGTSLAGLSTGGYMSSVPNDPSTNAVYTYQALTSASAACSATPCPSYVIKAVLETNHAVLQNDVDGTVASVTCADSSADFFYCTRP